MWLPPNNRSVWDDYAYSSIRQIIHRPCIVDYWKLNAHVWYTHILCMYRCCLFCGRYFWWFIGIGRHFLLSHTSHSVAYLAFDDLCGVTIGLLWSFVFRFVLRPLQIMSFHWARIICIRSEHASFTPANYIRLCYMYMWIMMYEIIIYCIWLETTHSIRFIRLRVELT